MMICALRRRKRCQDPYHAALHFIIFGLSGQKAKRGHRGISFYTRSCNLQMFTSKTFPQIQVELNDPKITWSLGNEEQALFGFNWDFELRLQGNVLHASRV